MGDIGANARCAARLATLHKSQRLLVFIHHRHGTHIVVVHQRERLCKRRRATHCNRRLFVGHIARLNQQQAFQCTILAHKRADKLVGRFREQLVGAGALNDFPLAEHCDAIAKLQRFVDIVAHQHHRFLQLALHLQELILDNLAVNRVDRAERLIHQQHRRIRRQRANNADTLLLPAGHLFRVAVEEAFRIQRHHRHQLGRAFLAARFIPAQHPGHHGDVLFNRHIREQANLLNDVADIAAQRDGIEIGCVFAVNKNLAAGGRDQPVNHLQRGGLAAARRAEQHAHFAFRHVQVDVIDGVKRLAVLLHKLFGEVFKFNH